MRRRLHPLLIVVALALPASAGAAIPAWTTYRHDAARSGIDPDSTNPVAPSQAWQTLPLDEEVYAQPLVYGSHVYVATENDTIYALDAATGATVWSRHLASPEPASSAPCGDITPSIGITSTPVIDPATNRIYAAGAVAASGAIHHELFALDLGSGNPVPGFPIMVDPPLPAGGNSVNQLQRAGLALDSGRVLIAYGGNLGDCGTYWGWLVSAPTDGSTALSSFQVDSSHTRGAIWASGNAPTIDGAGNVFVATGNGGGNFTTNPDYGDSVVKLNASASPLDWWSPPDWQSLDASDSDLGSSMPTLLPGGFVFQSGKDGNGYVLNGAHLGNVSAPPRELPGFCSGGSFGGSVYDPANSTLYVACHPLAALAVGPGSPPSLTAKAGFSAPSGASGAPMIAGGLVWVASSGGSLYGLDPSSGAASSRFSIPERGSDVNHFANPSAGGGRLFVGSGDQVTAFTIAQTPPSTVTNPPPPPPPPQPPRISRVSLSPRRFAARHPATLRLTLNEPATVTVAITQVRHGRRVGRRCSRRARHGATCLVRVTLRRLSFRARAGQDAFKLLLRRLAPGSYTALVYATDGTRRRSSTVRITFTIIRPRR